MIIIYNPAAGQRRSRRLWQVLDILSENGVRFEVAHTECPGHATLLAKEGAARGERMIVAAGGDGTIAEVAAGINGSGAALGVLPLGTANVLAHELSLPMRPHAIAAALAFGRTRRLWPGMATGPAGSRLFVQMVGVGLDAQVVHHLPRPMKRMLGRTAYVVQTLREMVRYSYRPIHVRVDGKIEEAGSVVVSKGTLYGGNFILAPGARPEERGFTVALFGRRSPPDVLMYGAALTLNLLPAAPGMRLIRAGEVEILGDDAMPVQADGDPAGQAPLSITDADVPISVVMDGS